MIETRIRAETLQDAVVAVDAFGLPGPVFCDVCPGNCGYAHVYFLTQEHSDEEVFEMLKDAALAGLQLVDGQQHRGPDGSQVLVSLDSVLMILDEQN